MISETKDCCTLQLSRTHCSDQLSHSIDCSQVMQPQSLRLEPPSQDQHQLKDQETKQLHHCETSLRATATSTTALLGVSLQASVQWPVQANGTSAWGLQSACQISQMWSPTRHRVQPIHCSLTLTELTGIQRVWDGTRFLTAHTSSQASQDVLKWRL